MPNPQLMWLRDMVIDEIAFCEIGKNANADILFFKRADPHGEGPRDRWRKSVEIFKTDDEQRIVYGWASVISKGGVPIYDLDGHCIEEVEMEKAAHLWLRDYGNASDNHMRDGVAVPVASMPFTEEVQKSLNMDLGMVGWVVGFEVTDDEVWAGVKSGDRRMFSIGGRGKLVPVEDGTAAIFKALVEVTGETEGHTHTLSFARNPPYAAGTRQTSTDDGHFHDVKIGNDLEPGASVSIFTEIADGHQHSLDIKVPNIEESDEATELPFALSGFGVWDSPTRVEVSKAVAALSRNTEFMKSGTFASFVPVMKNRVLRAWLRSNPGLLRSDAPAILKSATRDWVADPPQLDTGSGVCAELIQQLEKALSEPRLYDEVIEDQRKGTVATAFDNRVWALSDSVYEILWFIEGEDEGERDVQGLIQESVEQFAADMQRDLPGLFAGTILKASFKKSDDRKQTTELIATWITKAIEKEGHAMFEKLTDDEKVALDKSWELAKKAGPAEEAAVVLKTANDSLLVVLKAAGLDAEGNAIEADPDDAAAILKSIKDPAVLALLEGFQKSADEANESAKEATRDVATLNKARDDVRYLELAKTLPFIGKKESELVEHFRKSDEAGTLDAAVEMLTTANASAAAGFKELGTDATSAADGSAEQQLDNLAKAMLAKSDDTEMTFHKAYAVVCKRNPELSAEAISGSN